LLPRDNQEQIPFAFKIYQKTSADGIKMAAGYKQTFCQTVEVDFLGVWFVLYSTLLTFSDSQLKGNRIECWNCYGPQLTLHQRKFVRENLSARCIA
jgi:hypothetical protein